MSSYEVVRVLASGVGEVVRRCCSIEGALHQRDKLERAGQKAFVRVLYRAW